MEERCWLTDLPEHLCSHCKRDQDYEVIGRVWKSQFSGDCTVDSRHHIRRGENVARVQYANNPMIPVPGVACSVCLRELPRARR